MSYTYDYPRPSVTTDIVLFSLRDGEWQLLLIQRKKPPFQHCWAFPGGFLDPDESPKQGACRELFEETGISYIELKELGFWGRPGRDPRGHTITLAFWAAVSGRILNPIARDDALNAEWFPIGDLPSLAFDHAEIFTAAIAELNKIADS